MHTPSFSNLAYPCFIITAATDGPNNIQCLNIQSSQCFLFFAPAIFSAPLALATALAGLTSFLS